MIVTLFGLGYVGSTLASLLNPVDGVDILNLVDPAEEIFGRVWDLQHGGNWSNTEVRFNDTALIDQSDFVFFAAGYSNSAGQSRYEVGQRNKLLIKEVFSGMQLPDHAKIIAITNPVEQAAQWISAQFDHRLQVVGTGTSLDSLRLQSLLAKESAVSSNQVEAIVLGEHGANMIPIFSQAKVIGREGQAWAGDVKDRICKDLRGMATRIRETEPATRYGVAQCALGIMETLLGRQNRIIAVSIRINAHFQRRLGIEDDIFMSLPCVVEGGKFRIVDDFPLSESELEGLRAAAVSIAAQL